MKIRSGFVSNSSSSSFIIICKGEITLSKLEKALGESAKNFPYGEIKLYCKKCYHTDGADLNASKNIRDLWKRFHNPERAGCSQSPECLPAWKFPSRDLTSLQASPVGS